MRSRPPVASAPAAAAPIARAAAATETPMNPFAAEVVANPFAAEVVADAGAEPDTNPFAASSSHIEEPCGEPETGPASFNPFDAAEPSPVAATRISGPRAPEPRAPEPRVPEQRVAGLAVEAVAGGPAHAVAPAGVAPTVSEGRTLLQAPRIFKDDEIKGSAKASLKAQVGRLTMNRSRFKWHDRRTLAVEGGRVDIFGPGSTSTVKLSVNITEDVDECTLQRAADTQQKVLFLSVRRPLPGQTADAGVKEQKLYFFEFDSQEAAADFHAAISDARGRGGRC